MEKIMYDVVVSNVGFVVKNELSYDIAKSVYDEYVVMGYEQVSLWASNEHDPIELFDMPEEKAYTVHWIHTGKFEADYTIQANSQEEAESYVATHRLELEPENVLPLSDDYEQFL